MSISGEHRIPVVTERTAFQWPVVVALVGLAFAGAGIFWQVSAHGEIIKEHSQKLEKQGTDIQEVKDDIKYLRKWAEKHE